MNVVLISVDSLRADHVGFLDGDEAPATPAIDSIADDGLVFENAFANAPYTRASFPAILTGTYPEMYGGYRQLSDARPYLPEKFDESGYSTGGFHSNPHLSERTNYHRGFDRLYSGEAETSNIAKLRQFLARNVSRESTLFSVLQALRTQAERIVGSEIGTPYVPGDELNEYALDWLGTAEEPVFLWLHYMDVHHPYVPHQDTQSAGIERSRAVELRDRIVNDNESITESEAAELKRLYRGEVEFVDRCIDEVLATVDREVGRDDTVVVFLADHGEAFGEHDYWGHPNELHDEVLHIPLVVDSPARDGQRVSVPVSTVDLLPTVAELLDWEQPEQCVGDSLFRVAEGDADDRTVFAQASGTKATVRDQKHRLIRYLDTDKDERLDGTGEAVSPGDEAATFDRLTTELEQRLAEIDANRGTTVEEAEMSADVERRLEQLGYK